jgi:hypothetical protein
MYVRNQARTKSSASHTQARLRGYHLRECICRVYRLSWCTLSCQRSFVIVLELRIYTLDFWPSSFPCFSYTTIYVSLATLHRTYMPDRLLAALYLQGNVRHSSAKLVLRAAFFKPSSQNIDYVVTPGIADLDLPRSQYNKGCPIRSSLTGLIHCNEHHIYRTHRSSV